METNSDSILENGRKGTVFNIQRWAIQDGPGIRTTVFLKGCPLTCKWCSNPESQKSGPEIMIRNILCIGCGKCVDICPRNAISIIEESSTNTVYTTSRPGCKSGGYDVKKNNNDSDGLGTVTITKKFITKIDRAKCNLCLECADVCPAKAITVTGDIKSVDEVMNTVLRDIKYYRRSRGGMTISGGEPLSQWEFTLGLLKDAHKRNLHTALDTTGFGQWEILERLLEYTKLLLYDVKFIDPEKHRADTGVDNEIILNNLSKSVQKTEVWIRRIVIPGCNDSDEEIKELGKLANNLKPKPSKISLLPYHKFAETKYSSLDKVYLFKDIEPPTKENLDAIKNRLEYLCDIRVEIGK